MINEFFITHSLQFFFYFYSHILIIGALENIEYITEFAVFVMFVGRVVVRRRVLGGGGLLRRHDNQRSLTVYQCYRCYATRSAVKLWKHTYLRYSESLSRRENL